MMSLREFAKDVYIFCLGPCSQCIGGWTPPFAIARSDINNFKLHQQQMQQ